MEEIAVGVGDWFALGPDPELTALRVRVPERGAAVAVAGPAGAVDIRDVRPRGLRLLLRPDGRAELHRRGSTVVPAGWWRDDGDGIRFEVASSAVLGCAGRLTRGERGPRLEALFTAARGGGEWPSIVAIRSGMSVSGPPAPSGAGLFEGTLTPESGRPHPVSVELRDGSVNVFSTDIDAPGGVMWFATAPDLCSIEADGDGLVVRHGPEHERTGAPHWFPSGLLPIAGSGGEARFTRDGGRLTGRIEAWGEDPFNGSPVAYRATLDVARVALRPQDGTGPGLMPDGPWRRVNGPAETLDRLPGSWLPRYVPALDAVAALEEGGPVLWERVSPRAPLPIAAREDLRSAAQAMVLEGRFAEARAELRRALDLYGGLDPQSTLMILEHLIVCANALGDYQGLLEALRDASRLRTGLVSVGGFSPTLAGDSLRGVLDQVQRLERWRAGHAADDDRISQLDLAASFYAELVRLLHEAGEPVLALLAAEAGRARAFADLLGGRLGRSAALPPLNPERLTRLLDGLARPVVVHHLDGDRLQRWLARPGGDVATDTVRVDPAELARWVGVVDEAARVRTPLPPALVAEALERLGALLWPDGLEPGPVLVVPHGDLLRVPFAALTVRGRPLVHHWAVTVLPALGLAEPLLARPRGGGAALRAFVAPEPMPDGLPPLRDTRDSFAAIVGQYGAADVRSGPDASAAEVRARTRGAGVVYFATHGVLDADDPMGSYIALAPSDGHDGRLTAREILGLDLDAELVVLAACDGGAGRVTSDGVVGLSRAFLAAGPRAVVMSLAPVGELDSLDLMYRFHLHLLGSGLPAPEALRRAQAELADDLRDAPHRWAPFTLFGI